MRLAQQPQAHRCGALRVEQVVHRGDVVRDLLHVAGWGRGPLDLEEHQVGQGRLGAFDPTGHHGFVPHECAGEQVWAGQGAADPGQLTERAIRSGQPAHEGGIEAQGGWQRWWHERVGASLCAHHVLTLGLCEVTATQCYSPPTHAAL